MSAGGGRGAHSGLPVGQPCFKQQAISVLGVVFLSSKNLLCFSYGFKPKLQYLKYIKQISVFKKNFTSKVYF